MEILFTGATGVLGRAALPRLLAEGHRVSATFRSDADAAWLEEVGARPTELDLFDGGAVEAAVRGVDTVVHYATAIPRLVDMSNRESWEVNDRLRDTATGLLVDAAWANDVARFVQQSITFIYADGGEAWLDEASPLAPSDVLESVLSAEAHVGRFRLGGGAGIVLRLSRVYGPGKASAEYIDCVSKRKVPIVGEGRNYVSSIHVEDSATALVSALTVPDGTYNVTDDRPVTAAEYTESVSELLGAPSPKRIPESVARLAPGNGVGRLTRSQRVSNRRFVHATGWSPLFPSVLEGWRDVVHQT